MTPQEMLQEIDEHGEGLSTWETQFVSSLMGRDWARQVISSKEHDILRGIYEVRVPEKCR